MPRVERFIGRRIKHSVEKTMDFANPLTGKIEGAKKGCIDSVGGVVLGFLLFFLAFIPTYCSAKVKEQSKQIARMELQTPDEVRNGSGMVMIHGTPEEIDPISPPLECEDIERDTELFWYHFLLKEYRQHEETRSSTMPGGEEAEDVYMVEDWEDVREETRIAGFRLGDIQIRPADARTEFDDFRQCEDKERERLGAQWLTLEYILPEEVGEVYVIGNLSNNRISSGTPFIVSDKEPERLASTLAAEEKTTRFLLTAVGVILFFISFNLIIGPLLYLLQMVPVIGSGLRAFIGFLSLILSVVLVLLLQVLIRYWWVIVIIFVGVVLLIATLGRKKKQPQKAAAPASASGTPSPGTSLKARCSKCGSEIPEGSKFCQNCGAPV